MAVSFLILTFLAVLSNFYSVAVPHNSGINREFNSPFYDEVRQLIQLNDVLQQQQKKSDKTTEENSYKNDAPKAVANWPDSNLKLGQVSGVAVNSKNQPVIFHRADRLWDATTFNDTNHYQLLNLGPIKENTILTLHPLSGKVISQWGANMFYMPHGITIDKHDNLWITDVALHQVFKYRPGNLQPFLTFGKRLEPGSDFDHLCKPTDVAVASTGEIFIADGYCNSRILKFNAAGGLLKTIPNPPEFLSLVVPHALALIESLDLICVADRENMRVVCPRAGLYNIKDSDRQALTIQQPDMGRVFGVAARGEMIYAVNGPTSTFLPVRGFTIDPKSESVIDNWAPAEGFGNPHAIAVSPNGAALYVAEIMPNRIWKFELVPPK